MTKPKPSTAAGAGTIQKRENIKTELRRFVHLQDFCNKHLQHRGNTYECPFCEKMKVGLSRDECRWYANCCHKSGDIFDIDRQLNGGNFNDSFIRLAKQYCGLRYDSLSGKANYTTPKHEPENEPANYFQRIARNAPPIEIDNTAYYKQCVKQRRTLYNAHRHIFRGVSIETLDRFQIGVEGVTEPHRIVFPATRWQYRTRELECTEKDNRYRSHPPGISITAFGLQWLLESGAWQMPSAPVYIAEGGFDMLSIFECGVFALSIEGVTLSDNFLKFCTENPPACKFIVAFDNDESGREYQDRLVDGLQRLGIRAYGADVETLYFGHKDPSEAFQADRERLKQGLVDEIEIADAEWRRHPQSPNSKHSLTATSIAQNGEKRKHFDEKSDPYTDEKEDIYKALNL